MEPACRTDTAIVDGRAPWEEEKEKEKEKEKKEEKEKEKHPESPTRTSTDSGSSGQMGDGPTYVLKIQSLLGDGAAEGSTARAGTRVRSRAGPHASRAACEQGRLRAGPLASRAACERPRSGAWPDGSGERAAYGRHSQIARWSCTVARGPRRGTVTPLASIRRTTRWRWPAQGARSSSIASSSTGSPVNAYPTKRARW